MFVGWISEGMIRLVHYAILLSEFLGMLIVLVVGKFLLINNYFLSLSIFSCGFLLLKKTECSKYVDIIHKGKLLEHKRSFREILYVTLI